MSKEYQHSIDTSRLDNVQKFEEIKLTVWREVKSDISSLLPPLGVSLLMYFMNISVTSDCFLTL